MKKLERVLKDFYASRHEFATITRDLFGQVKEAWNQEVIEEGYASYLNHEVGHVLEVFNAEKFPKDYEFLTRLYNVLEEIEQ